MEFTLQVHDAHEYQVRQLDGARLGHEQREVYERMQLRRVHMKSINRLVRYVLQQVVPNLVRTETLLSDLNARILL